MGDFFLYVSIFCFGMAAGMVLVTYQATRPNGYEANSGRRYRLVEITSEHSPAQCKTGEA